MANLEGQQFYLPGEEAPAPTPWYKQARVLKRLGLGLFVGAVLVLIVVFVVNLWSVSSRGDEQQLEAQITQEMSECAGADDQAACEAKIRSELARSSGTPAACAGLETNAFRNCVSVIAFDAKDATLCASLDGDDRTVCADTSLLLKATSEKNYVLCSDISNVTQRESCQAQILPVVVAAGQCEAMGIAEATCSEHEALNAVIAAGDPTGCATLPTLQASCTSLFNGIDEDQDGLSLADEYEAGTDPANADTDGDGYTDGNEVLTGHDPTK